MKLPHINQTVSVIIPVYNGETYLPGCIESILRQNYEELEILLVDDGSRDASGAVCDMYQEEDGRIQVIHKENGGLMSAWRAGVAASTGRYLCFVDCDDWLEPLAIADMARQLRGIPGEIICCNHVIDKEQGETRVEHGLPPGTYEGGELQGVFHQILGNERRSITMSRCMKLISRELIEENLKFCNEKLRMGEDVNIILPALLDSKRLVVMQDAYYYHYVYRWASMVHAYDQNLYENIRLLRQVIERIFREKVKSNRLEVTEQEVRSQCQREYLFLLMLVIKNEVRGNRQGNRYLQQIREICRKENTPWLCRNCPIRVRDRGNLLIYLVMRYPVTPFIWLLRKAVDWFYKNER